MAGEAVLQRDIAAVFGHETPWVSKMQARAVDPMPRDLAGAIEWGKRNARLPADFSLSGNRAQATTLDSPPLLQPPPNQNDERPLTIEEAERELKILRAREIQTRLDLQSGELIHREQMEEWELQVCAELRAMACEFPVRVRAILERHISDAGQLGRIMSDVSPVAAEILNRSDPKNVLHGKSREEIRAALLARVEEIVKCF